MPDYFDESVMDEYEELWEDFLNYKIKRNSDLLLLFITKLMMYLKGEKFQYNNLENKLILQELVSKMFSKQS